ncbi:hypothetical protein S40288_02318 [Stachybotrys chartarum IBT 40288]|nr:hypothetical protein S40288_02318 [Stachybotrys chartarum IBT 40288]
MDYSPNPFLYHANPDAAEQAFVLKNEANTGTDASNSLATPPVAFPHGFPMPTPGFNPHATYSAGAQIPVPGSVLSNAGTALLTPGNANFSVTQTEFPFHRSVWDVRQLEAPNAPSQSIPQQLLPPTLGYNMSPQPLPLGLSMTYSSYINTPAPSPPAPHTYSGPRAKATKQQRRQRKQKSRGDAAGRSSDCGTCVDRATQRTKDSAAASILSQVRDQREYHTLVAERLDSYTRTGQACNRCKVRKIKCDANPIGCSNCRTASCKCETTDPTTKKRYPRGYAERNEEIIRRLWGAVRTYEARLRDAGLHVMPLAEDVFYENVRATLRRQAEEAAQAIEANNAATVAQGAQSNVPVPSNTPGPLGTMQLPTSSASITEALQHATAASTAAAATAPGADQSAWPYYSFEQD